MFTANQLICHAIGDYIIQSDWMANQKINSNVPAIVHALTYSTPFLFLNPSLVALIVIVSTHFFIDRYRLAKYVCYYKNFLNPDFSYYSFEDCSDTGYYKEIPVWLSVWLMIITDNIMHVVINALALTYL